MDAIELTLIVVFFFAVIALGSYIWTYKFKKDLGSDIRKEFEKKGIKIIDEENNQ